MLQRCDMVERRRDVKTTTIQRRNDVVCLQCSIYYTGTFLPQLYEVLTRNGDEDLLEGDESDERLELLLRGDFDLLEEDDDDELLLVHLRFSFFFGDLEGLRERPITSLFTERYFTKTPPSGVKPFFLTLILSTIIW